MSDKEMFQKILKDKGEKYQISIDNDHITVWNKEKDDTEYTFDEFPESFIESFLKYIGLDAERV